jgi:hypothetical protein
MSHSDDLRWVAWLRDRYPDETRAFRDEQLIRAKDTFPLDACYTVDDIVARVKHDA